MKGWQYIGAGKPLTLGETADPVAAPGQVIVDVKAAGICHTDVAIVEGWAAGMLDHTPLVLGHEVAGVIAEIGEGVTGFAVGDRVGIAGLGPQASPGVGHDGGFAPRTTARPEELVRIPDSVPFDQAASGTDAGMTAYHAVHVTGGVTAGQKVGIIGLGGLGQIGARVAVLAGAEVYVAERNADIHDLARSLGAADVVADASAFGALELDVIVDFVGADTTAVAIEVIKPGGRIVQVGVANPETSVNILTLVMKGATLVGTLGGTPADIEAVYALLASGDLDPKITQIRFDEIGDGLERLQRGDVRGRLVAVSD